MVSMMQKELLPNKMEYFPYTADRIQNFRNLKMTDLPVRPRLKMARQHADKLTEIYSSPPIPVHEIAEMNGVRIIFTDFRNKSELISGFCDFRNSKLFVNREDIPERQIFTMAHELGHWLLHREFFLKSPDLYPVLPRFNKVDYSNSLEIEANQFAANLLVPERLLRPLRGQIVSPSAMARLFFVSRTMMEIRLKYRTYG